MHLGHHLHCTRPNPSTGSSLNLLSTGGSVAATRASSPWIMHAQAIRCIPSVLQVLPDYPRNPRSPHPLSLTRAPPFLPLSESACRRFPSIPRPLVSFRVSAHSTTSSTASHFAQRGLHGRDQAGR